MRSGKKRNSTSKAQHPIPNTQYPTPVYYLRFFVTILRKIFLFYYDGFRNMTVGRRLWIIILIKLFILFIILRLIFFPDFLKSRFSSEKERGDYVREQLLLRK
jgi:hypothetical protein